MTKYNGGGRTGNQKPSCYTDCLSRGNSHEVCGRECEITTKYGGGGDHHKNNRWITFLKAHKGSGLSIHELSTKYHQQ